MMNWVETLLARWTGRATWPTVDARFEERFSTEISDAKAAQSSSVIRRDLDNETTDDIFSYEVQGKVYTAAVQEIAGHGASAQLVGHSLRIQYNPRHPGRIYYKPACQLAGRLVGVAAILAALTAIGASVYVHTR